VGNAIATGARLVKVSEKRLRVLLRHILGFTALVLALTIIPGEAVAQSGEAAEARIGTEILLLGTAAGPPLHKDRSEPSSLLIVDGRSYLIDCGIGTIQRLVQADIRSETIGTIFITHHHADHDLGLADVMANDFFRFKIAGPAHPVNIYGPPQTKELVDAAFRYIIIPFKVHAADGLQSSDFESPFVAHEIQDEGLVYQDDKIRVIAAENSHYALMPAQFRKQMKSYSYRIETPHGVIVFTGDTGPSEAVIRLAKEADVLVSEGGDFAEAARFANEMAEQNHWSPERAKAFMAHMKFEHLDLKEVGEIASKARVKSVVLYHYIPADRAAYAAGVKKYFSGPVFAPVDLDRYCLSTQPGTPKSAGSLSLCQEHSAPH